MTRQEIQAIHSRKCPACGFETRQVTVPTADEQRNGTAYRLEHYSGGLVGHHRTGHEPLGRDGRIIGTFAFRPMNGLRETTSQYDCPLTR